jgi:hypothetical protein
MRNFGRFCGDKAKGFLVRLKKFFKSTKVTILPIL